MLKPFSQVIKEANETIQSHNQSTASFRLNILKHQQELRQFLFNDKAPLTLDDKIDMRVALEKLSVLVDNNPCSLADLTLILDNLLMKPVSQYVERELDTLRSLLIGTIFCERHARSNKALLIRELTQSVIDFYHSPKNGNISADQHLRNSIKRQLISSTKKTA